MRSWTMLCIHLMPGWFGTSDPAVEEALQEVAPPGWFAGWSLKRGRVLDETTLLNFGRLLEQLRFGTEAIGFSPYTADR